MSDSLSSVGIIDVVSRDAPPTAPIPSRRTSASRCGSCGYLRHGLPEAAICPECGHDPAEAPLATAALNTDAWWARGVIAGLMLLAFASFVMLGVTAYMRFRSDWGGSLPILNYVGPKVWGAALLQRSIGYRPGEWGVTGTQFGLLIGLAVWLITLPRPVDRLTESLFSLRRLCRWGTLLCLGGMLGMLLSEDGVSSWDGGDRNLYHLLLLSLVELPATTLLYLHLRQLGVTLRDPILSRSLTMLTVAVPACIGVAVGFLLLGEVWQDAKHQIVQQSMVAIFGAGCVALSALGAATLGRLVLVLFPAAIGNFGAGRSLTTAAVLQIMRLRNLLAQSSGSLRHVAIGTSLLGLIVLSIMMTADVLQFDFRSGYGGNWPMVNVPGPKVWAVPLALRFEQGGYKAYYNLGVGTESVVRIILLVNLVWLLTIAPGNREESRLSFRRLTRWGVALLIGVAIAATVGITPRSGSDLVASLSTTTLTSAYTLPLTMFVEAPATLLLYLYLGHLARTFGRPAMGRQLIWVGIAMTTLIVAGNGFFVAARFIRPEIWRDETLAAIPVIAYGAAAVIVGAWAAWCVLCLAGAAFAEAMRGSETAKATSVAPASPIA